MKEVKTIIKINGEYDFLLNVEVPNLYSLNNFVMNKLRKFKSVKKTTTMIEEPDKMPGIGIQN